MHLLRRSPPDPEAREVDVDSLVVLRDEGVDALPRVAQGVLHVRGTEAAVLRPVRVADEHAVTFCVQKTKRNNK